MTDRPEPDLLGGIDAPRPLPAGMRQRLEDRLLGDAARPLDQELSGRLSEVLAPLPLRSRRRARWVAAAAAAGLVVAGGAGLALEQGGGRARSAASSAASPSRSPSPSAASSSGSSSPGAHFGASAGGSPAGAGGGALPGSVQAPGAGPLNAALAPKDAASGSAVAPAFPAGRAAPVVTGLTPDRGPAGGGTWVTISGGGFAGVTAVRFAAAPASRFVVVSASVIRVLAPGGSPGTVDVRVVNRAGTSAATAADRFTYTRP